MKKTQSGRKVGEGIHRGGKYTTSNSKEMLNFVKQETQIKATMKTQCFAFILFAKYGDNIRC